MAMSKKNKIDLKIKNNTVYDKTKPLVIPKGQPYKKGTKYKATKAGR